MHSKTTVFESFSFRIGAQNFYLKTQHTRTENAYFQQVSTRLRSSTEYAKDREFPH